MKPDSGRFKNYVYDQENLTRIDKLRHECAHGKVDVADFSSIYKDIDYLIQALYDLSHFYDYGTPFEKQISEFDKKLILNFESPSSTAKVINELENTNSINKYVSIHTFAIQLAEEAGEIFNSNLEMSKRMLYYGLIFEAFANHFLQDHFAAGTWL